MDALLSQVVASGASRATALHARQRTVATAVSYFWRFYQRGSFATDEPVLVAVACLSLAGKTLENPVHDHTKFVALARAVAAETYSDASREALFACAPDALLPCELRVLDALKFDLTPYDPHAALQEVLRGGRRSPAKERARRREGAETDAAVAPSATGRRKKKTRRRRRRRRRDVASRRVGRLERFARHADVCLGLGARGRGRRGRRGVRAPRRRAPGDGVPGRRKREPRRRRLTSRRATSRRGAGRWCVTARRSRKTQTRRARCPAEARAPAGWRARPLMLAARRAQAAQIIEAARRAGRH